MKKDFWLTIYECEHHGDVQSALSEIHESGGKVLSSELHYEREVAVVHVEAEDYKEFNNKFSQTDTFEFTEYGAETL